MPEHRSNSAYGAQLLASCLARLHFRTPDSFERLAGTSAQIRRFQNGTLSSTGSSSRPVLVGTLDTIKLRDAVRFALLNAAFDAVLFVFAAPQLTFDLEMCALRQSESKFCEYRSGDNPVLFRPRSPFILIVSPRRFCRKRQDRVGCAVLRKFLFGLSSVEANE